MKTRKNISKLAWMAVLVLGIVGTASGGIIYVDDNAAGANDGSSWSNAFNNLQNALAVALSADDIWVAQGIYKPDQGAGMTPGDRTATFQLKNGVTIEGGYAGFGEPNPDSRDINEYKTILSGDLSGDDDPGFVNHAENSYHVVTGSGTDETAVLDGVTITGGYANGPWEDAWGGGILNRSNSNAMLNNCTVSGNFAGTGGGMYNGDSSSPTLSECTFSGNSGFGAGMWNWRSSPILTDCVFSGNKGVGMRNNARSSPTLTSCVFSGNQDGGMLNTDLCSPTLFNCTFTGNSDPGSGGGMSNLNVCNPVLINCTFSENRAEWDGAGMYNFDSDPTLINCCFTRNFVRLQGAGMCNENSNPRIINCTFSGNYVPPWGGAGSALYNRSGSCPTLTNCILWGDSRAEIWNVEGSTVVITYSDVQGGWVGEGNIDADPLFVDALNDDYHVLPGSPCIDAGTNNPPGGLPETDLDGNPRIMGYAVDMGAYEAISPPEEVLIQAAGTIANLDPESLKNPNSSNALTNKIDAVLAMIDKGQYEQALRILQHDILKKTDGCANTGAHDKNDWIITCEGQGKVYPLIVAAIWLLERLI